MKCWQTDQWFPTDCRHFCVYLTVSVVRQEAGEEREGGRHAARLPWLGMELWMLQLYGMPLNPSATRTPCFSWIITEKTCVLYAEDWFYTFVIHAT